MGYFASATPNDDADRRSDMILLATVLCSQLVITDGDTFECNGERIRVLGLDTPETYSAQCDAEYRLGLVAKRQLQELIGDANLEIRRKGIDRYDRDSRRGCCRRNRRR